MTPRRPDGHTDEDPGPDDSTEGQPDTEEDVDEEAEQTMPASDPPANY